MRIEKISKDKIKIMIDGNEAKAWNISFKNISENTPEVQKMFWTALRLAEKNVDFSVQGAKLFVEAVKDESEEDGFGMLVTRVCSEEELKTAISNCGYQGRLKRTELKAQPSRQAIYRFRDFDAVCYAAEQMADFYEGKSVPVPFIFIWVPRGRKFQKKWRRCFLSLHPECRTRSISTAD